MNTLTLIKKQIEKQSVIHYRRSLFTYRGVDYTARREDQKEVHGTFCYRGRTYTK